ncbi:MAG TPA: CHAT domain-containing tetratricopeptide repeat protein [Chitinophagaceae bacterium]|nr:CHAT domain-containing tetratricopeptide repeat protein [Chitinophagaceae bacterium]
MKQFLLLLLFICISFIQFGDAQEGGPAYKHLYRQAEDLYNSENPTPESDSLAFDKYGELIKILETTRQHDSTLVDAYTKAALLKQMKGEDSIAIIYFNKGLKMAAAVHDTLRFLPLLYCGSSYYILNQFDSARHCYQQAESIIERYPHLPERERLYNKIGTLYYEEGNFRQSLNYFSKALSLLDTTVASNNFLLVNYYNNIAVTYKKLGRYQEALNTYRRMLRYRINLDGLMHNIATVYLDLQQPAQALQFLHTLRTQGQQQYNNLAFAHLQLGNTDSAALYVQKAFKSRAHNFKTTINGLSWYCLGMIQERRKQYAQALQTYHRSVMELDPDFYDTSVSSNPSQYKGLHSFTDLFNALTAKARVQRLLFEQNKNLPLLEHSLNTWESALLLARTVQQGYEADESRLFLNRNLQPASEEATSTALALYHAQPSAERLEKVFRLAESSKAAVLQIRLQQTSVASLPGMPAGIIAEQKKQQLLLARLQVQYEQTTDTLLLSSLRQQMRDQEIRLSEVNQQLNNDPNYAAARAETVPLEIEDLQRSLPSDMAMLSYYFIKDKWLAFVLRKNGLFAAVLPDDSTTAALPANLRMQLSSPELSGSQLQAPVASLYQWLIAPVLPYLQNASRLMIIPDHDLQYLPFEILAGANGKRLQEDFAISYNYSAVFAAMRSGKASRTTKQLGMAPFAGQRNQYAGNFAALPASAEEIKAVSGEQLLDSMATKKAFARMASSYNIIHLATHASANDREPQNSFIAFFPSGSDTSYKLFQPEIYNLDLGQAKLVILSACETGHGQFVHGEGMMSLARAFSYAGCRSVITSLWKADDAATAYITRRLHHYLEAGKPKDVALQQAKLDYLADGFIPNRLKIPAYWSHLVLIGDPTALRSSSFPIYALFIAVGVLLVIVWFVVKRINKKPRGLHSRD